MSSDTTNLEAALGISTTPHPAATSAGEPDCGNRSQCHAVRRTTMVSKLSVLFGVGMCGLVGAASADARQNPGTAARPVTATGCVLPIEQVRGGAAPRAGAGPRFILMH